VGEDTVVLSGLAERIGLDNACITFKSETGEKTQHKLDVATHLCALEKLFSEMTHQGLMHSLGTIGHRVAHGGSEFKRSVLITPEVMDKIHQLSELAPLHNPANLVGIETAISLLPDVPQIAVFDTAFHQTMPVEAYTYAIPLKYRDDYQIRRYGFHGTSYRFIAEEAVKKLGLDPSDHGILIAHLGNGSSVCAVKNGKSVDTSMGMTPLEGLVMGTRCGDIDFGAATYLAKCTKKPIESICQMVNTESGLLGISGLSSDCRTLQKARGEGNENAALAIDIMVHRLVKHLGGHMASLDHLDALVFTGGIGENSSLIRALAIKRMAVFGFKIDEEKNESVVGGVSDIISMPNSPVILVLPTNEELMIARDAKKMSEELNS